MRPGEARRIFVILLMTTSLIGGYVGVSPPGVMACALLWALLEAAKDH